MSAVEFEVPAKPEYVSLARMLVGSVAATRRDIDDELLDDLRLAVSEACTLLLQDTDADGTITLRLGEDDQALTIDVRGMSGVPIALVGRHANDDENVVALIDVIRALVDDVIVITDDGHESLRMRLVCAPVPALP